MKKTLLVACAMLASVAMYADGFTSFSIEKTDGSTEHLPAVGTKITFSSSALNAMHVDVQSSILLNQVAYMYFSNENTMVGVDNVALHDVRLINQDGMLQLTAPTGMHVTVRNVTGQLVNSTISTGSEQTIASSLAGGVYLVQIGSETLKTIVR